MANTILDRLQAAEAGATVPEDLAGEIAMQAAKSQATAEVNRELQTELLQENQVVQQGMANAIADLTKSKQVQSEVADLAKMGAQRNVAKMHQAGGGREIDLKRREQRAAAEAEVIAGHEAINETMDTERTGFDFLDGIINIHASIGDRLKLESDQERLSAIDKAIAGNAAAVSHAASTEGHLEQTVTEGSMLAKSKEIEAFYKLEGLKLEQDANNSNAMQIQRIAAASGNQLEQLMQQTRIENAALATKNNELRQKQLELAIREQRSEAEALDLEVELVTKAQKKHQGYADDPEVLRSDIKRNRKKYVGLIDAGMHNTWGNDVGESVRNIVKVGGSGNPEQDKVTAAIRNESKPGKELETAEKLYKKYSKSISANDKDNWFNFGGLPFAKQSKAVTESSLYKKVFAGAEDSLDDHDVIIKYVGQALIDKTITFKEAAVGIRDLFQASTAMNSKLKDFKGLRLDEPTKYMARVTMPVSAGVGISGIMPPTSQNMFTSMGSFRVFDLLSLPQIETMLLRIVTGTNTDMFKGS